MNELKHYGVQGMRWGVRNYQNKDGSLTAQGRRHYNVGQMVRGAMSPTVGLIRDRKNAVSQYKNEKKEARTYRKENGLTRRNSEYRSKMREANSNFSKNMNKADDNYLKKANYGQIAAKAMLYGAGGLGAIAIAKIIKDNNFEWKYNYSIRNGMVVGDGLTKIIKKNGLDYVQEFLSSFGQTMVVGGVLMGASEAAEKFRRDRENENK